MYRDLLPLGTGVDVKEAEESIMICGRLTTRSGEDRLYDYVGVPYPMGISSPGEMLFFNDGDIDNIDFIGCKNEIEKEFREKVLAPLDEAESISVVNGKIEVK